MRRMRTRCRFGSQRRFEATIECERWLPNDGFFPQIAQIFDIAGGIVATSCGHWPGGFCAKADPAHEDSTAASRAIPFAEPGKFRATI